jgi:hypothetical protein
MHSTRRSHWELSLTRIAFSTIPVPSNRTGQMLGTASLSSPSQSMRNIMAHETQFRVAVT